MKDWQSQAHVRWDCKYHIVIVPKCRRKLLYGKLRPQIGRILRNLCEQKRIELIEGFVKRDHVHMCLAIPPRYSVAYTIGFLKGKSAIRIHRQYEKDRKVWGKHFWATGYCVSTVGLDEEQVRRYIREQEKFENGQNTLDFD